MMDPEPATAAMWPAIVPVQVIKSWLPQIFPEGVPHRKFVVREMAAKTIFVMLYTGAVEGMNRWFRPAQATLMTNAQAAKLEHASREKWASDSLAKGRLKNTAKCWYAMNSRESIRDETLRSGLIPLGAVRQRPGVAVTAQIPRYALSKDFCDLLVGLHRGTAAASEIEKWRAANLSAEARTRVKLLKAGTVAGQLGDRLQLNFPNGETRLMLNGPSALITNAVVEDFALRFLRQPAVLLVSDSGEKIVARDEQLAEQIGLHLEIDRHLPDVILVDATPAKERIVFVEVVATAGAMTEEKRQAFAQLAKDAKFASESVFFVTAFSDRSHPSFRSNVPKLAGERMRGSRRNQLI